MIVSINQPAYLPWLGYFHRIAVSDLHIVLDHVQFEKNSFTNRNKARTKEGWCWLTVPVKTRGKFGDLEISKIAIAREHHWAQKHWATIQSCYSKAPYFSRYEPELSDLYNKDWSHLIDLLTATAGFLLKSLDINTPLVHSSKMQVEGRKDELVLNLCKAVEADLYLSGPLGRNYLDEGLFEKNNIKVVYHDYGHPVYRQVYPGFEPFMSALDLLLNHGPDSLAKIMENQEADLCPGL